METIKIKIAGKQNLSFFISLIEKLNFIKEYTVSSEKKGEIAINHFPLLCLRNKAPKIQFASKTKIIDFSILFYSIQLFC
jgi:hypothetical protein